MKKYVALFILVAAGAGAAWVVAGCAPGPMIEFIEPVAVGQVGELVMTIDTPGGELSLLEVTLEQGGETMQVFNLATRGGASGLVREGEDLFVLRQPIGRQRFESLSDGSASVAVTAGRPVLFGLREAIKQSELGIEVRLRRPVIVVQSQFHYINHGGSELVVYRVTPADSVSGVRVGEREYPGIQVSRLPVPVAKALILCCMLRFTPFRGTRISTHRSAFSHVTLLVTKGSATFDQHVFFHSNFGKAESI